MSFGSKVVKRLEKIREGILYATKEKQSDGKRRKIL